MKSLSSYELAQVSGAIFWGHRRHFALTDSETGQPLCTTDMGGMHIPSLLSTFTPVNPLPSSDPCSPSFNFDWT